MLFRFKRYCSVDGKIRVQVKDDLDRTTTFKEDELLAFDVDTLKQFLSIKARKIELNREMRELEKSMKK